MMAHRLKDACYPVLLLIFSYFSRTSHLLVLNIYAPLVSRTVAYNVSLGFFCGRHGFGSPPAGDDSAHILQGTCRLQREAQDIAD